jgi:ATP phosphoribosyltransferase
MQVPEPDRKLRETLAVLANCNTTLDIESPTVMSLEKPGWFSVKSMVKRREAQQLMDQLARQGCRGILLTAIDSVRI